MWARTSQEVELESTRVFKLCLAAFKDESESTPETLVEVYGHYHNAAVCSDFKNFNSSLTLQTCLFVSYKTWAHYQPATVVLAFLTKLIGKLEMLTSVQAPNKVIRFIYTLFDELFARTVEEEDEIIFIVRSVTLQLQMAISPVRFSRPIRLLSVCQTLVNPKLHLNPGNRIHSHTASSSPRALQRFPHPSYPLQQHVRRQGLLLYRVSRSWTVR